jgi:hypothetical protein
MLLWALFVHQFASELCEGCVLPHHGRLEVENNLDVNSWAEQQYDYVSVSLILKEISSIT